jgi:hypothetical protein
MADYMIAAVCIATDRCLLTRNHTSSASRIRSSAGRTFAARVHAEFTPHADYRLKVVIRLWVLTREQVACCNGLLECAVRASRTCTCHERQLRRTRCSRSPASVATSRTTEPWVDRARRLEVLSKPDGNRARGYDAYVRLQHVPVEVLSRAWVSPQQGQCWRSTADHRLERSSGSPHCGPSARGVLSASGEGDVRFAIPGPSTRYDQEQDDQEQ